MEQTGGAQPTKQTKKVIVFKKQKSKKKEMKKKKDHTMIATHRLKNL